MNGPVGYNIRYRKSAGWAKVTLRVSPSVEVNAMDAARAIAHTYNTEVEIWRSGEHLSTLALLAPDKGS